MLLCDYGCGQEAQYYFKTVEKWCCCKSHNSCPAIRKKMSDNRRGENHTLYGKVGYWKNKKRPEHSKKLKGKKHHFYGRKRSNNTKRKIGKSNRLTISKIKKRYPLFSKIEEMRYNPDKPGEIQVHCKNHNCPNSKEKGGWFTPKKGQLSKRIEAIENPGGYGESNFYCSDECKNSCPLYRSRSMKSLLNRKLIYTQEEINLWRKQVLNQDNHQCQRCGSKENLHCHHIIPGKINSIFTLDPDNGIVLCKDCHYSYGHKEECSTIKLANMLC